MEQFLKETAWEEDLNGGTKVYLVKDNQSGAIVFFFALKAGLLYRDISDDDYELSEKEREILNLCLEHYLENDQNFIEDEILNWYDDNALDKDKLRRILLEKLKVKSAAKSDQNRTEEGPNIVRVSKTFPGIVLTHFCKGNDACLQQSLSFPLGFYVFWEIVIQKVLKISSMLGCQYLYLFAADHTEFQVDLPSLDDLIYLDADDEPNHKISTYKLVEYYKNELKFEEVHGLTILKPYYDFECFSLIQPISKLSKNRELAWIQHSDAEN